MQFPDAPRAKVTSRWNGVRELHEALLLILWVSLACEHAVAI